VCGEDRPFEGWYYRQDGQVVGPVPTGRLKELLAAGLLFIHAATAAFGTTHPSCPPPPSERVPA
jgi:hypothetical protein